MADQSEEELVSYSQFACIGAGISAIGLGATLKRWYNINDIRFFERHDSLGGTWYINKYPGCACDIPSALYSYSFEQNPGWSRVMSPRGELCAYLRKVCQKYDILDRMSFNVNVDGAEWIEERSRWRISLRHVKSGRKYIHESQFLFSGSGLLVTPRELDVPGVETFKGQLFHSARWPEDADIKDKKVVVFGNGATACQIVPTIVDQTKHLTQIIRTKHWILPPVDGPVPEWMQWALKNVPLATRLLRLNIFTAAENELRGFSMTPEGQKFRDGRRAMAEKYMKDTAPPKYYDKLIPEFEINCKRRIFDSGYLASLYSENLTLTDSPVIEIVPEGVRTKDGIIEADIIVTANGFVTNHFLHDIDIKGRGGVSVEEHWDSYGGVEAYNCSVMSGFPNFFVLLGPNSVTGHTSAIMASENSINYALRIIKPVLDGKATVADLKPEAERKYVNRMQEALRNTVWNSGCQSWYIKDGPDGKTWNAMSYPWSQSHYWYRSFFPAWSDWQFSGEVAVKPTSWLSKLRKLYATLAILFLVSRLKGWSNHSSVLSGRNKYLATLRESMRQSPYLRRLSVGG